MFYFLKKIPFFFILLLLGLVIILRPDYSWAITQTECEQKVGREDLDLGQLEECQRLFETLMEAAQKQERDLGSEVNRFNSQISLTNTQIAQKNEQIKLLEEEIELLAERVTRLDEALDKIAILLARRIEQSYKKGKADPLLILFSSQSFPQFLARFKYFRVVQLHDQRLAIQMAEAKENYHQQKEFKQVKQEELDQVKQKLELDREKFSRQKKDKERFLAETQGNKEHFRQLLAVTRAEVDAIQRIAAGEGECAQMSRVNQGDRVATLISGPSACSTGTHLHFEVREGDEVRNPFSYLRPITLLDDSGGDPHQASGDWEWPLNEPIRFNQGFGPGTAAIRARIVWYDFHTGIDIVSEQLTVKAVKPGDLYRCSIPCGGGNLKYVKVDHEDSNLNSYYLHVNY
ncbi:MAG: hypothetical protein JW991_03995 [Candidatus Pacebacteria bacterium]|nr:hypothetical protein [Candidatus Paceibacterota bacterium]